MDFIESLLIDLGIEKKSKQKYKGMLIDRLTKENTFLKDEILFLRKDIKHRTEEMKNLIQVLIDTINLQNTLNQQDTLNQQNVTKKKRLLSREKGSLAKTKSKNTCMKDGIQEGECIVKTETIVDMYQQNSADYVIRKSLVIDSVLFGNIPTDCENRQRKDKRGSVNETKLGVDGEFYDLTSIKDRKFGSNNKEVRFS